MRDWTKAMAALLAAVASVGIVRGLPAQASPEAATKPAVKADDEVFGQTETGQTATDVNQADLKVTDLNSIELHVNDAPLLDVLRALADRTKKNIITSRSVGGKVTANLYNVTFHEALDAILHANGFAYREQGNFIYVYTAKELADIKKAERKTTTQTFRLNYVPAALASDMIKPALSDSATIAMSAAAETGLPEGGAAGGNNFAASDVLVVTDYDENLERVRAVLKDIDQRPQQILVEATIVQATLDDNNSLGIDFTLLGGVDFSTVGSTNSGVLTSNTVNGSADAAALSENGFNTIGTNVKGPQTAGLNVGVAYNNIAVFLNALETITDTHILANPKVLTVNKQPGAVIVGNKDGYITTTATATTSVQTVEFLESGTRLIFRPFISDDGFIRMEIHPENSTGQVVTQGAFIVPKKTTTEVTTNVLVKDGHTIVIGGLFRETNKTDKSQVPLLGDIPLAGALFRSQTDTSKREEIILLLTPHIVKDQETFSEASLQQMKAVDLLRAGVRQGMMPWSRDRLAEMSYNKAREEVGQKYYDRERAMWYLDCATNLSPMFTEALQLKQQVSGKQIMETDNSTIRHFVTDLILDERAKQPANEPATAPADVLVVPPAETAAPAPAAPAPAPVAPPAQPEAPAVTPPAAPAAPAVPAEPAVKELPPAEGADSSNK